MNAISLYQPWASLWAHGIKTIETRSWATNYRGLIAIHSTKSTPKHFGAGILPYHQLPQGVASPHSCIVGVACIDDCVLMDEENIAALSEIERELGDYKPGRWSWLTSKQRPLPQPIAHVGHQGVWPLTESVRRAIMEQLV